MMDVRLAEPDDLPQLKAVYQGVIEAMNRGGIQIWDDIYPCAFFADDIEQKRLYLLALRPDWPEALCCTHCRNITIAY